MYDDEASFGRGCCTPSKLCEPGCVRFLHTHARDIHQARTLPERPVVLWRSALGFCVALEQTQTEGGIVWARDEARKPLGKGLVALATSNVGCYNVTGRVQGVGVCWARIADAAHK